MIRRILRAWARRLGEPRVIWDNERGESKYLSRYYLLRERPPDDEELPGQSAEEQTPRRLDLFVHCFHRSDRDSELHSHPWAWGLSLVLYGGYWEERRVGDRVVRKIVKPWRFNFMRADTYHRVELVKEEAWSLFLVGPKLTTWFFWCRERKARMQWRTFIKAKRGKCEPQWEPDSREAA